MQETGELVEAVDLSVGGVWAEAKSVDRMLQTLHADHTSSGHQHPERFNEPREPRKRLCM